MLIKADLWMYLSLCVYKYPLNIHTYTHVHTRACVFLNTSINHIFTHLHMSTHMHAYTQQPVSLIWSFFHKFSVIAASACRVLRFNLFNSAPSCTTRPHLSRPPSHGVRAGVLVATGVSNNAATLYVGDCTDFLLASALSVKGSQRAAKCAHRHAPKFWNVRRRTWRTDAR